MPVDEDALDISQEKGLNPRTSRPAARVAMKQKICTPVGSGVEDYIGAFAVTAGHGLDGPGGLVAEFEAAHDDYSAIMVKALAESGLVKYEPYAGVRLTSVSRGVIRPLWLDVRLLLRTIPALLYRRSPY